MRQLVFGSAVLTILMTAASAEADAGSTAHVEVACVAADLQADRWLMPPPVQAADPQLIGKADEVCVRDANTLCLLGGRFISRMGYSLPGRTPELGKAVQLSDTSGYFEYAELPGVVQVLVNVIDGCGLGGHFWVFMAGLTDVASETDVKDTRDPHGLFPARGYIHPRGVPFSPVQDTSAFATCP